MKILYLIALITISYANPNPLFAKIVASDSTDLEKATALRGCNFIEVMDGQHLHQLMNAATEFSCPDIVLTSYDKNGNLEYAKSYPRSEFLKAMRENSFLPEDKAYLILTRYTIYFLDRRKRL